MNFTYEFYKNLISLLKENNYCFCDYHDYMNHDKCVILRHDIDYNLESALTFAELEKELGVKSTYFVLCSSDFYNPLSKNSKNIIHNIINLGHDVGLHFDETVYANTERDNDLNGYIEKESQMLSTILGYEIKSFSLHRPNIATIGKNIEIPGLVNSYSEVFFSQFKYLSDSRMHWREPVEEIIKANQYNHLHVLTHAFWYSDSIRTINEAVLSFVKKAEEDRLKILNDNITNLYEILNQTNEVSDMPPQKNK